MTFQDRYIALGHQCTASTCINHSNFRRPKVSWTWWFLVFRKRTLQHLQLSTPTHDQWPVPARRWNFCQKLTKRKRPELCISPWKILEVRAFKPFSWWAQNLMHPESWCSLTHSLHCSYEFIWLIWQFDLKGSASATGSLKESALAQLFSAICSCTLTTSMGCVNAVAPTTATPLASKFSVRFNFLLGKRWSRAEETMQHKVYFRESKIILLRNEPI